MTSLTLTKVAKHFGPVEVISGIDLAIKSGEFVVFVGPSGCGKSTLLRMIAGLESISGGVLAIGGARVNETAPAERGIAMVFQSYALYPHMSVYKNMAFGLETMGMDKAGIDARVMKAAEILQIVPLLPRKPKALSGGQRQRVAIGRAIVREPKIFLFDEPLSNLDAELRVQTRVEIAKLHASIGATMIYVTHDQVEAMTLADRIVVLRSGQVEQFGAPLELYNRPANKFVAGFIGSPKMNFLTVTPLEARAAGLALTLAGKEIQTSVTARGAASADLALGVRPEHIRIAGNDDLPPDHLSLGEVSVEHVEHLGGQTLIYGRLGDGQKLTVTRDGQQSIRGGDRLPVIAPADLVHLFDAAGANISLR